MKIKLLTFFICFLPAVAGAAIPYRTEQKNSNYDIISDNESFAAHRRFYIGGGYNFASWQNTVDKSTELVGTNNSSFDVVAGVRVYDTFRLEANYYRLSAAWGDVNLSGDTVFLNAIFDGRIDSAYRAYRSQILVPYVGFGAGVSMNSSDNVKLESGTAPVAAGIVGIAFEFNDRFSVDIGYRYFFMFSQKINDSFEISPTSNQLRAGVRVNF